MIIINDLLKIASNEGYEGVNATTKVAQDIILTIISKLEYNKNITLKGGVLMRSITKDARRTTQDLDIDLIRYSIEDIAIKKIIEKMNGIEDIEVSIDGNIKKLNQQDYKGREVHLKLMDKEGTSLNVKLDIGVQADMTIEQEEYCFDVGFIDGGITILANTKEQIFVEKLFSLLKWDIASTRYKDIYDLYFLTEYIDKNKLKTLIENIIYKNQDLKVDNINAMIENLNGIFSNDRYLNNLKNPRHNWIEKETEIVTEKIISFVKGL